MSKLIIKSTTDRLCTHCNENPYSLKIWKNCKDKLYYELECECGSLETSDDLDEEMHKMASFHEI